ncbi:MAG: signal peptidase I [Cellulomonas sp.]|nr:signal peptidase I [Cellulomonas sp.]
MRGERRSRAGRAEHWLGNFLLAIGLALGVAGAAAVISGRYQVRPVLSGSMRPGLPVGGVVVTERVPVSALQVRDVVVFHRPDEPQELVVHRIIALTPGASGPVVQTQGDANVAPDPWNVTLRGVTAYRVVFAVPLIGYAAVWAHSTAGRGILTVGGLLLVVGASAGSLLSVRRSAKGATRAPDELPPDAPVVPSRVDAPVSTCVVELDGERTSDTAIATTAP